MDKSTIYKSDKYNEMVFTEIEIFEAQIKTMETEITDIPKQIEAILKKYL